MTALTPKVYCKAPSALLLTTDQRYLWCSCGQSNNQPFCDGSHPAGFKPLSFTPNTRYTVWLCNCKHTRNPPYCDGAHNKLP